jgi:hypothetical protein
MEKEPSAKEVDLDRVREQHLLILYRQTRNLLIQSKDGLLSPSATAAFTEAVKLRQMLKREETDQLDSLSEEELEKLVEDRKRIDGA